jgi:hypothetical protein
MSQQRKCLYCLESAGPWKREHVLSKFLGGPDRYQLDDVCENCNTKILSSYEDYFKQETPEGYLASMYGLGRGSGYMSAGRKLKVVKKAANISISPEWFFKIDLKTSKGTLPAHTTFKSGSKTYTAFETLSLKDLRKKIQWFRSDSVEVVNMGKPGAKAFGELDKLGGTVSKTLTGDPLPAGTTIGPVEFHFTSEQNLKTNRVIAKIAFNYLSWCALSSANPEFIERIYKTGFNPLRCYILIPEDKYEYGELVTPKADQRMIFNGREIAMGAPFHYIRLGKKKHFFDGTTGVPRGEHDVLYIELNLFSLSSYEVFLAFDQFPELEEEIFGCAHLIDLSQDKWVGLDANNNACGEDNFGLIQGGKRRMSTATQAYRSWLSRGCLHGSDWHDWFEAERWLGLART